MQSNEQTPTSSNTTNAGKENPSDPKKPNRLTSALGKVALAGSAILAVGVPGRAAQTGNPAQPIKDAINISRQIKDKLTHDQSVAPTEVIPPITMTTTGTEKPNASTPTPASRELEEKDKPIRKVDFLYENQTALTQDEFNKQFDLLLEQAKKKTPEGFRDTGIFLVLTTNKYSSPKEKASSFVSH